MVAKQISFSLQSYKTGADTQNRTGDLILTKDALYRLSHISTLYLVSQVTKKPALTNGLL